MLIFIIPTGYIYRMKQTLFFITGRPFSNADDEETDVVINLFKFLGVRVKVAFNTLADLPVKLKIFSERLLYIEMISKIYTADSSRVLVLNILTTIGLDDEAKYDLLYYS